MEERKKIRIMSFSIVALTVLMLIGVGSAVEFMMPRGIHEKQMKEVSTEVKKSTEAAVIDSVKNNLYKVVISGFKNDSLTYIQVVYALSAETAKIDADLNSADLYKYNVVDSVSYDIHKVELK